jgi:PST family polysaccharide transporter
MNMSRQLNSNIASLFILQATYYALSLITIPYLVRVLGPAEFGDIAFAQAFIQYFVVFTDYGFNLSATREVALHRESSQDLSRIFSAVMIIKIIGLILGFVIILFLVSFVPIFVHERVLFLFSYLTVVGNVIFPLWLLQGLAKMRRILVLTAIARLLTVIAIFTLVTSRNDMIIAASLLAGSTVVSGVLALVTLRHITSIRIMWPGIPALAKTMRDGWHVFLSMLAVSFYTNNNAFILGLFVAPVFVGYFAAAEKLIRAVQGLLGPVSQSVYPHIAGLVSRSPEEALRFIGRLLRWQTISTVVVGLLIFILAPLIVHILLGPMYHKSILLLRLLAPLPIFISVSNVLGTQTMLNFGLQRDYSRIMIGSTFMYLFATVILAEEFGGIGTAISIDLTEALVSLAMIYTLVRQRLLHRMMVNAASFKATNR